MRDRVARITNPKAIRFDFLALCSMGKISFDFSHPNSFGLMDITLLSIFFFLLILAMCQQNQVWRAQKKKWKTHLSNYFKHIRNSNFQLSPKKKARARIMKFDSDRFFLIVEVYNFLAINLITPTYFFNANDLTNGDKNATFIQQLITTTCCRLNWHDSN